LTFSVFACIFAALDKLFISTGEICGRNAELSMAKMQQSKKFILADISSRILSKMQEMGLSRTDLFKKSRVSYRLLYDIQKAKKQAKLPTYQLIAQALGVSEKWLLTGSDAENIPEKERGPDLNDRRPNLLREQPTQSYGAAARDTLDDLCGRLAHMLGLDKKRLLELVLKMAAEKNGG
jgi:transcriptional regulator with XRE-family HTH domain